MRVHRKLPMWWLNHAYQDVNDKIYTVKIDGDEKQVQTFAELVRPYGIKEFVRSGKVAITKNNQFSNLKKDKLNA